MRPLQFVFFLSRHLNTARGRRRFGTIALAPRLPIPRLPERVAQTQIALWDALELTVSASHATGMPSAHHHRAPRASLGATFPGGFVIPTLYCTTVYIPNSVNQYVEYTAIHNILVGIRATLFPHSSTILLSHLVSGRCSRWRERRGCWWASAIIDPISCAATPPVDKPTMEVGGVMVAPQGHGRAVPWLANPSF
jgi:hypothetical protein